MVNNMIYLTSEGWQTSIKGENIITKLMPEATVPEVKTFSLYVKSDCVIKINNGKEVTATNLLGVNYTDMFKPVKSIEFVDDDIEYFIAYGI